VTGPEHYAEAEGLIRSCTNRDVLAAEIAVRMAMAQVHATLALCAATIDAAYGDTSVDADEAWGAAGARSGS
jgi:hypothetical protein